MIYHNDSPHHVGDSLTFAQRLTRASILPQRWGAGAGAGGQTPGRSSIVGRGRGVSSPALLTSMQRSMDSGDGDPDGAFEIVVSSFSLHELPSMALWGMGKFNAFYAEFSVSASVGVKSCVTSVKSHTSPSWDDEVFRLGDSVDDELLITVYYKPTIGLRSPVVARAAVPLNTLNLGDIENSRVDLDFSESARSIQSKVKENCKEGGHEAPHLFISVKRVKAELAADASSAIAGAGAGAGAGAT